MSGLQPKPQGVVPNMDTNQQQQSQQQSQQQQPVNAVQQQPQAEVMTEQQALSKILGLPREERVYDMRSDVQTANFLADLAEANGQHQMAAKLRGVPYDNSWAGAGKRLWDAQYRVSTSVKIIAVLGGAYLIYSGFAYYFDLPFGIFGKQSPTEDILGAVKGKK